MSVFTMKEVADLLGVNYKRLWYAVRVGDVRASKQVGRFRLFDDLGIVDARRYFEMRGKLAIPKSGPTLAMNDAPPHI